MSSAAARSKCAAARRSMRRAQEGVALIALLAVLVLGASWYLVESTTALSRTAADREHNARVLAQAKEALLAWAATNAAHDDDPGRLPCAQNWGDVGGGQEGRAGSTCITGTPLRPDVGWLPWRTLGLPKLVDSTGQQLWYVVSPGWALPTSGAGTVINSNTPGQITVDGRTVVAAIVAPGSPLSTGACGGAAARDQSRLVAPPGGTPDYRDYMDCQNAVAPMGSAFVSTGPSGSFNDQVVTITAEELLPRIEAAIADRLDREIAPALRGVYASATWRSGLTAANPAYPFPAPFADPGVAASFNGSSASCDGTSCRGLLPMRFNNAPGSSALCTTAAHGPLCDPTFVRWQSGTVNVTSIRVSGVLYLPGWINGTLLWSPTGNSCTVNMGNSPHSLDCTLHVPGVNGIVTTDVAYQLTGIVDKVAGAMRVYDSTAVSSAPGVTVASGPTIEMQSSGAVRMSYTGTATAPDSGGAVANALCGLFGFISGVVLECRPVVISIPMTLFPDHALLDVDDPTTGWFIRNEWYKLVYYAAAQGHTAAAFPASGVAANPTCTTGTNCLTVSNVSAPAAKRAVLILAGRTLTGAARPNADLTDFLDANGSPAPSENQDEDAQYVKLPVNRASNDRFVIVDEN